MYFDAVIHPVSLKDVPRFSQEAQAIGFDALWVTETKHDPFLQAALISEHTDLISFGTSVAIAFARSPTTIAYSAWDLAQASRGRFILGLGTQVKAHIVRRFGMPWPDSVVGKLREQILAIRMLWKTWQSGESLRFKGDYFKLSLMSPFFNPGPIEHPHIPIWIAGVNQGLAKLAGELADGFFVHPLHSIEYLTGVLLPAIDSGSLKTGRDRREIQISASVFVSTTEEQTEILRNQIGFYASTPSYRSVMKLHGWDDVSAELSNLAGAGQWAKMSELISADMLEQYAVVGTADELPARLISRYSGIVDRLHIYLPYFPGSMDGFWKHLIRGLKG